MVQRKRKDTKVYETSIFVLLCLGLYLSFLGGYGSFGRQTSAPKDVHTLIPRTCEYVRLHDKREIKVVGGIKVDN